jgi:hypothetical protein
VSRKGGKSHKRSAKSDAFPNTHAATVSVLPMELQIGDRLTDQDLEWEVVTRPEVLHGAKSLRARIQRPGLSGPELAFEFIDRAARQCPTERHRNVASANCEPNHLRLDAVSLWLGRSRYCWRGHDPRRR